MRNIGLILLVVGTFALGFLINSYFFKGHVSTENSQVMLEKIKNVCKVINVEGYFTEVYDYKDYWQNVGVNGTTRKYSPNNFENSFFSFSVTIASGLGNFSFNSFTTEDYNKINANAKDFNKKKEKQVD